MIDILVHAVLAGSVMILAVLLIRLLFKKHIPARLTYALWIPVAIGLLLPIRIPVPVSLEGLLISPQGIQNIPLMQGEGFPQGGTSSVEGILLYIWIVGAVVVLSWIIAVNSKRPRGVPLELTSEQEGEYSKLCRELKIRHKLPLQESESMLTPCLSGVFSPVIFINREALSEKNFKFVLLHELYHYKHCDPWFAILRSVCCVIFWFHPLVWLSAYLSRQDGEAACDSAVISHIGHGERLNYADAIISMIQVDKPSATIGITTYMSGGKKNMKTRINSIIKPQKSTPLFIGLTCILVLLATSTSLGSSDRATTVEGTSDPATTKATTEGSTQTTTQEPAPEPATEEDRSTFTIVMPKMKRIVGMENNVAPIFPEVIYETDTQ